MTRDIAATAEGAFRIGGAAFNGLLLSVCLYAAFSFYSYGTGKLAEAGGLVSLQTLRAMADDPALALQWIAAIVSGPGLAAKLGGYALAWFAFIGAAGSAWMSILGLRWFFHALLRATLALR